MVENFLKLYVEYLERVEKDPESSDPWRLGCLSQLSAMNEEDSEITWNYLSWAKGTEETLRKKESATPDELEQLIWAARRLKDE
jgi:hypothetical protein